MRALNKLPTPNPGAAREAYPDWLLALLPQEGRQLETTVSSSRVRVYTKCYHALCHCIVVTAP